MLDFLLAFYDKFPEYKGRPLYITGEVRRSKALTKNVYGTSHVVMESYRARTDYNIPSSHMVGTTYPPSAPASWPTTARGAQRSAST